MGLLRIKYQDPDAGRYVNKDTPVHGDLNNPSSLHYRIKLRGEQGRKRRKERRDARTDSRPTE